MVQDVSSVLQERVQAAISAGIFRWNIVVDPGIGFAKGRPLNLELLRRLSEVKASCHDLPLLVCFAASTTDSDRIVLSYIV